MRTAPVRVSPPALSPVVSDAVIKAEAHAASVQTLRQGLEMQQRISNNLDREFRYGYDYLRAIEADLREQRIRLQEEAEHWKKLHPLRTAATSILGEPAYLRELRERNDKVQQDQRERREERKELERHALENAAKQPGLDKQLEATQVQERAAWTQVESLLRGAPALGRPAAQLHTHIPIAGAAGVRAPRDMSQVQER